jgi:phosphatidylglycerophosphate synthase
VKTALILPATASSFEPIAGLPVIQRTVLCALRSGFDRVVVVGGPFADRLRALFAADARTRAVEVADAPVTVEGSHVALIPADCVITAATLRHVNATSLDGRPLVFSNPSGDRLALCRPAMLAGIDVGDLGADAAEALWAALRDRGAETVLLDREVYLRINDGDSVAAAERALCAQLRADSAASDGPLAHWIDRHVSLRLSRRLARHRSLRPNHITIVGTSVGLLAAAVLSIGTYWAGVVGTLLFLCATIIDGCDGEVARLTFQESAFGEKFDVITDNIVHVAIFAGLGVGLYHQLPRSHWFALLVIMLGGFALAGSLSYFFLERRPGFARSGGKSVSFKGKVRRRLLQGLEALMNRDFAYLLVLFALVGRLHWFLWATAFGTYLFSFLLVWIYRWREAG